MAKMAELIGKTFSLVERDGDHMITFRCTDGDVYRMEHEQDCCETVSIEEVIGDLSDLVDSPIVEASKESNRDQPPKIDPDYPNYPPNSYTWTFYKIGSQKGFVTIRWFGESNGYYSEEVSLNKNGERWGEQDD